MMLTCMQDGQATKFFIDKQAFAMEQQRLFSLGSLRSVLVVPAVIANTDRVVRSPQGSFFHHTP